jgi:hypothetical protein
MGLTVGKKTHLFHTEVFSNDTNTDGKWCSDRPHMLLMRGTLKQTRSYNETMCLMKLNPSVTAREAAMNTSRQI